MTPVIEVRDLCYEYAPGRPVLAGVSLAVCDGETVALLGPNGAGKSTLMLHLNGTLRGQGEVRILGEPASRANLAEVRRAVGLVFQNPDDQLFMPTVFDDVAFGPLCMGCPEEEVRRRVASALERVGMSGSESRPPHHLSVGQKKRVALAGVLAMDARVLVLDEPSAGLDPRGRRELISLLADLNCPKIIATHDLDLAAEVCSRGVLLDDGSVVAEGPIEELLVNAPLLEEHGLDRPPAALVARLAAGREQSQLV